MLGDVLFGFSEGEDAAANPSRRIAPSYAQSPSPGLARTDRREGAPEQRQKFSPEPLAALREGLLERRKTNKQTNKQTNK